MSDSIWRNSNRIVAAVTCAVLAAILLCAVWQISALDTKESIAASHRTSQYAKDTEQQITEACTTVELEAMRECVTKKVQASEENQRAADNLVAQNAVARWTFWMLVLGLGGTALTGAGLYYLAANLDEMREGRKLTNAALNAALESTDVARHHADAEFGPNLVFFRGENGHIRIADDEIAIFVECKNIGKSAAINVDFVSTLFADTFPDHPISSERTDREGFPLAIHAADRIECGEERTIHCSITLDELTNEQKSKMFKQPQFLRLSSFVVYDSKFGPARELRFIYKYGKFKTHYRRKNGYEVFPRWKVAPIEVKLRNIAEGQRKKTD
jgi:hypothetical protein